MNFYKRFHGDYLAKTRHLALAEHGAYSLMLDWVDANEQPLPADKAQLYRICCAATAAERRGVDRALREFWRPVPEGWRNPRADEEIAEAQPRIAAAKQNGKRGRRARQFAAHVPRGTKPAEAVAGNPACAEAQTRWVAAGEPGVAHAAQARYQPEPEQQKNIPTASDAGTSSPDPYFGFGLDLLRHKGVAEKAAQHAGLAAQMPGRRRGVGAAAQAGARGHQRSGALADGGLRRGQEGRHACRYDPRRYRPLLRPGGGP